MNIEKLKWDLNDIVLIPSEQSEISSRKECQIESDFTYGARLPLMASPMDTVVSGQNYTKYIQQGIIPCIPRGLVKKFLVGSPLYFQSFSLSEIEEQLKILDKITLHGDYVRDPFYSYPNILIDIANGHMIKLIDIVKQIKKYAPTCNLMIGNVANPETFINLGMAGADYVRCSVGTGAGCTTAANVSINYPLGSLISECYSLRKQYGITTKIVTDGGMKNYADIIKALALGCFLPSTLVYTKNGFKQIQNINVGEIVYTHTGEYKKVINKFKYENNKDIISINGIFSTNNHHYYVIHKKHKDLVTEKNIDKYAEWIAAEDLNSDYLLIEKNINLPHRMQMYFKNIFSKIYILYLKLFKKLHEKLS
jgi:IMP dehydrogenase/GMP reductase